MCILCVIQKWSRRVATMLPWLVIPLIGLWLLSQLLPPAFRFEITSPRLACVLVLLLTLFWYEILMPQLSAWRMRRNAQLRERKRFEAIEMQKLKKTATRRCRNCQNPYRDQNPGGGKFMCSYCGHISKRPVLDLPVPPGLGLSNSGILKDLVGKSGKILNGKVWSDNGWMCGQDWLDNGNWVGGPLTGKSSHWRSGAGLFGGTDHCLAEKSYSRILNFAVRAFSAFFLSIIWLCRKVFRVSSSRDDASSDAERTAMLDQGDENGVNCHESKGERARRKAEEKRQARLEKELLEEEERKQREEVARLVEERRRLRDEKMEAEKERRKGSPPLKERESKKEAEKKRQERKKERDRGSSKSNSDAEELEKRGNKESERYRRSEGDRRDHHKTGPENVKAHGAEVGHTFKGAPASNARGNAGTRYFDRVRGTFLSSSRAFTGVGFFGKSSVPTVSRDHKSNAFVDHMQATTNRREVSQPDRFAGKSNVKGDEKNINRPALIEPQTGGPGPAPKKSWQQLFTHSASSPCSSNVISRPNGNFKPEVQNSPFASNPPSTQAFDNPINFGLPSPFTLSPVTFVSTNSSTGYPLSNESMFPRIGEASHQYLPEESEIFEDPCYVPDPVSLLGPVSESLDNFQLDLGLVADSGLETPCAVKNVPTTAELHRPSPIESPMSRLRVPEERHASSFSLPSTPKAQDLRQLPIDGSPTLNEAGTWQMWTSSPLGQDGLGLVGGSASWLLPPDLNRPKNEDILHHVPQKTMASLFKKDDQVLSGTHSPQKVFVGSVQNGGSLNSVSGGSDGSWLPNTLFGPTSSSEDQFSLKPKDEAPQINITYGSSRGSVSNHQADVSAANCWPKKDWNVQGSGLGVGNPSMAKPHIGGLYSSPDVQSLWSYD